MRKGFSLVELMIVVAIIGILAAIAIPSFVAMQLKAKRAEVPGNVDGIKTAELSYDASFDGFVSAANYPGAVGKQTQPWSKSAAGGFTTIGWAPDGDVRGTYEVTNVQPTNFDVHGACDVDGDGAPADYTADVDTNASLAAGDENVY